MASGTVEEEQEEQVEPEARRLRWGIVGTGRIAGTFAAALAESRSGRADAVASRNGGRAEAFARGHGISRPYDSYAALLSDAEIDAVYIATPHPQHAEWAIRAAESGKHVLCEKPLALNHAEAMAVVEAARRGGVFLLEAFAYRFHPQTALLLRLVREGPSAKCSCCGATTASAPRPGPRTDS